MKNIEQTYTVFKELVSVQQWLIFFFLSVFAMLIALYIARRQREYKEKIIISALLLICSVFILLITLIARTPTDNMDAEWIPLWSWYEVIFHHDSGLFIEICQNLLMLVPIGAMLRILKRITVKQAAVIGLVISSTIEFLQLITHRGLFEWDDILHNSIGSMIGCLIVMMVERKIKESRQERGGHHK